MFPFKKLTFLCSLNLLMLFTAISGSGLELVKEQPQQQLQHDKSIDTFCFICGLNALDELNEILTTCKNVNVVSANGSTPLRSAINSKNFRGAELLLKKGANINHQNEKGQTLLHTAAFFGDTETMEFLLQNGANPDIQDYVEICDANERTRPILLMPYEDYQKSSYKREDDSKRNCGGQTALDVACSHTHKAVVKLLIKHRANCNIPYTHGTALHSAASNFCSYVDSSGEQKCEDSREILYDLLDAHADVNAKDCNEETILFPLIREFRQTKNHSIVLEAIKRILQTGYDCTIRNKWHNTPLHEAIDCAMRCDDERYLSLIELLIQHKADVNSITGFKNCGWTPLMQCCRNYGVYPKENEIRKKLIRLVLSAGADPFLTNCHGENVFVYIRAIKQECGELFAFAFV